MDVVTIDELCRCCLNEKSHLTSLYDKYVDDELVLDPEITNSEAIFMCTNIRFDESDSTNGNDDQTIEFPRTICDVCLNELRVAVNFRAKCEASDRLLRQQRQQITESNQLLFENFCVEEIVEHEQIEDGVLLTVTDDTTENEEKTQAFEEHLDDDDTPAKKEYTISDRDLSPIILVAEKNSASITYSPVDTVTLKGSSSDITLIRNKRRNNNDRTAEQPKIVGKHKNYFECDVCKNGFSLQQDLNKHIEYAHKGRVLHLCSVCGQMCPNESSLRNHLLQHQGKKFHCESCPKQFFTKRGYDLHCDQHQNPAPLKKHVCSVCAKNFSTKQRLKIHMLTHSGLKPHSCDVCTKSFGTESRLRSHRRVHTGERPYKCTDCGLTFAQGNALKCHKRIHTGERPFQCKFCGKRFTQNTILKTHLTLHTGKTVKCPDCDKKFSRASYLILHRREHTGEKPYACDQCPNRYKQKSHLDRHMDTHLGVKYICSICKKEYSKQWSLKQHMYSHSDKKPFQCEFCPMDFIRKDKYKNHIKSAHDTEISNSPAMNLNDLDAAQVTHQT